jgi:hypothetical protein
MLSGIKQSGKRMIASAIPKSLIYRQGNQPNILLISSRRGGSSFLAGLISCDPSIRYFDQPFDLLDFDGSKRKLKESLLPHVPMSQFIDLTTTDAGKIRCYMEQLLSGQLDAIGEPYIFPKSRTLLKECDSMPLVDWFSENFNLITVYLIRHPVPQSLSILRSNWEITARAYLENPLFSKSYLSNTQLLRGLEIMNNGTSLEKAVLNWIMENIYPLRFAKKIDLMVTYEELTLFPDLILKFISEKIGLKNITKMRQKTYVPSSSNEFNEYDTNQAIKDGNRSFLVNKWLSKVNDSTKNRIQNILTDFGIHEYDSNAPLPDRKLFHFWTEEMCETIKSGSA